MSNKIKLALLSGGISGEREVSLKTGDKIYEALDRDKYEITRFDPKTDMREFIGSIMDRKFDLVLPALHGPYGEDGRLQGLLDMLGIAYVFSGTLASALAMDKHKTKIIAQDAGLDIPRDVILCENMEYSIEKMIAGFGLPLVIKPVELGSSVGASIANTENELERGILDAFRYGKRVMLEEFIPGRELTVSVIGAGMSAEALPVIEIIPKVSGWFDYRAKYEKGGSDEVCPAEITEELRIKAQKQAVKIFQAVGCKDLARVDFIWKTPPPGPLLREEREPKDGKLYFLEINTIPGMTETSLAPQAAKAAGMGFSEFLDRLIEGAIS